jgi:hypothetical protein
LLKPRHVEFAANTRTQIVLHWLVAGLVLAQDGTSGAMVRTCSLHLIGQRPNPET